MKWITRENVKVDRVACPWLIKKFIDPAAEFVCFPSYTDWASLKEGVAFYSAEAPDVGGGSVGTFVGRLLQKDGK